MISRLILLGSLVIIGTTANPLTGNTANQTYNEKDIFDCITGPCVQVPGVGKLQGSKKKSAWKNRDIYSFYGIPYAESTADANRFQPPVPKAPLNDGRDAFDASCLHYNINLLNQLCVQPGMSSGEDG